MDRIAFAAAALSLLATPGPTDTLLATSGAEVGLRRSLPLLGAELGGYLLAILLFARPDRPADGGKSCFRGGVYLLYLAWALRRRGARQTSAGDAITFPRVFVTTLLNPRCRCRHSQPSGFCS